MRKESCFPRIILLTWKKAQRFLMELLYFPLTQLFFLIKNVLLRLSMTVFNTFLLVVPVWKSK